LTADVFYGQPLNALCQILCVKSWIQIPEQPGLTHVPNHVSNLAGPGFESRSHTEFEFQILSPSFNIYVNDKYSPLALNRGDRIEE